MSEIVKGEPERSALLSLPTFERFEALAVSLAAVREEAAMAREPTVELLARLDEAISLAAAGAGDVISASTIAGKVDVANYLFLLERSYLYKKDQDVQIFAQVMLGAAMSLQPTMGAIEIACRRWVWRSRFMPEVADLLGELKSTKDRVENTLEFVGRLPALREGMARELGQA